MNIQAIKGKNSEPRAVSPGAKVLALPSRPTDEEELVAGLIHRRPSAVQALYSQYSGIVRRILIQMLGSDRDVEDLTQDTLITVIERAPALRKVQSLRCFVIGVAIHLAKMRFVEGRSDDSLASMMPLKSPWWLHTMPQWFKVHGICIRRWTAWKSLRGWPLCCGSCTVVTWPRRPRPAGVRSLP